MVFFVFVLLLWCSTQLEDGNSSSQHLSMFSKVAHTLSNYTEHSAFNSKLKYFHQYILLVIFIIISFDWFLHAFCHTAKYEERKIKYKVYHQMIQDRFFFFYISQCFHNKIHINQLIFLEVWDFMQLKSCSSCISVDGWIATNIRNKKLEHSIGIGCVRVTFVRCYQTKILNWKLRFF